MSDIAAFVSAITILLAVPGPTNTLLFLSGAERGFRKSLRLMIGESAGYLSTVVPLAVFAAPSLSSHPVAGSALKLVAASWVLFLALKLWRRPKASTGTPSVTLGSIFVTTLLNPKGLVIGLTIMPGGSAYAIAPWVGLFVCLLAAIACLWIGAGSLVTRAGGSHFDPVRALSKVGAVLLAGFSVVMASSAIGLP
jgi:threonine/homoserine/homoserine lactone efflux protein